MKVLRGETVGAGRRVAIVASRFNELVTSKLVEGACGGLSHHGVVPEEIPLVARRLAASGRFDAVICLGAVIRGETSHFELIAAEAARGISEVGRTTGVPCIFEVLATDDLAQALARAGGEHGNKGWEAAGSALEMASLMRSLPAGKAAG